jgi:hypothetical protein
VEAPGEAAPELAGADAVAASDGATEDSARPLASGAVESENAARLDPAANEPEAANETEAANEPAPANVGAAANVPGLEAREPGSPADDAAPEPARADEDDEDGDGR